MSLSSVGQSWLPGQEAQSVGVLQQSFEVLHELSYSDWQYTELAQGPLHPFREFLTIKLGPNQQQSSETSHLPMHCGHSWERLLAQDK